MSLADSALIPNRGRAASRSSVAMTDEEYAAHKLQVEERRRERRREAEEAAADKARVKQLRRDFGEANRILRRAGVRPGTSLTIGNAASIPDVVKLVIVMRSEIREELVKVRLRVSTREAAQ